MTDCYPKETRSKVMSRIRAKNTKPETILRKALWNKGHRYRIHHKLTGKPDIVFVSRRVAIFVDGCFWHKCPKCFIEPKSNRKYWMPKLAKNVERDKQNTMILRKEGWTVIRIWEHQIKRELKRTISKIEKAL